MIFHLAIHLSIIFAFGFGIFIRHEMYGWENLKSISLGWVYGTALYFEEIPSNAKNVISYINDIQVDDRLFFFMDSTL